MRLASEQAKYKREQTEYRDGCAYVEHETTLQVRFHDLGRKERFGIAHTSQMSAASKQTLEHKKNMVAESLCTATKSVFALVVACMRADVRYVHQQAIIDVFAGTHDASVEVVNDVHLKNTGRVRMLPFLHCFQGRSLVRIVG